MTSKDLFTYFILNLVKEKKIDPDNNDFSKLKVLKLLFLLCQASSKILDPKDDLFHDFKHFRAYPLGPVEENIYNSINNDDFSEYFTIDSNSTKIKNLDLKFEENNHTLFIKAFISYFSHLFEINASKLVELTHSYESWRTTYKNKNSEDKRPLMSVELMRKEPLKV